ncbi:MAG: hypothetical protein HYT94_02535 [Parcubacteria group bacterium]|nr:hypothetical protein [Parcubacteria group bacterium]
MSSLKHTIFRLLNPLRRFLKKLDDRRRKVFYIVAGSCIVLILGGIVLIFTDDGTSATGQKTVKIVCRDSDGEDMHKKGTVTYTDQGGGHVDEDYCAIGEGAVYEMVCRKESFWGASSFPEKKTVPCPLGCVNGMCRK